MSWRPKKWKGYGGHLCNDCYCIQRAKDSRKREIFEAGADAMYEPAYSKGKEDGKKELLEALEVAGLLSFIPGEEENGNK